MSGSPDNLDVRFAHACRLENAGRFDEAHHGYLAVLERDPEHFGALTYLGSLLQRAGNLEVARALYTKALVHHPDHPMAHVNLGNALAEDGESAAARAHFETALRLAPGHPKAHFGLALLERRLGDADAALRHDQLAFVTPSVRAEEYRGGAEPLNVLIVFAANGGNVVTNLLLDDRVMQIYSIVAEGYEPGMPLPEHHVLFNAIGDTDRADAALLDAIALTARTDAPVLNDPVAVLATGRPEVAARLGALPGVVAPRIERLPRATLTAAELERRGFTFPLLVRSPGFHTGDHFELVPDRDALAAIVAELPGDELFAIEYLDLRDAAGDVRKYRAIFAGGGVHPLHLAISRSWKVHYFSADMREREEHRAEEAVYLDDMTAALGSAAVATLETIRQALGLDYGGIDFALDAHGNVVVFEANATMAVFNPDDDACFDYRRPAVERIIAAFQAMVVTAARSAGYTAGGAPSLDRGGLS